MKRKNLFGLLGAMVIALIAICSFSTKVSSLGELKAKATAYCQQTAESDCESTATGHIYIGYKLVNGEVGELED